MAQMRYIRISATACFTVCMGLCILAISANAIIPEDDDYLISWQECKRFFPMTLVIKKLEYFIATSCAQSLRYIRTADKVNEDTKAWYTTLLRSKPQFGFERDSRFHGKPTFIRFGKRDFSAYNPNFFNNK